MSTLRCSLHQRTSSTLTQGAYVSIHRMLCLSFCGRGSDLSLTNHLYELHPCWLGRSSTASALHTFGTYSLLIAAVFPPCFRVGLQNSRFANQSALLVSRLLFWTFGRTGSFTHSSPSHSPSCFRGAGNTSTVKNSESTGLEPRNSTASPTSGAWMHYLGSTNKQIHVQIRGAIFDETQQSHQCEVSALMRWQASGQIQSMWA